MKVLKHCLLALCVAAGAAGTPVLAAGYPSRPITIIVPFTAGGGADNMARLLGKTMQEKLGQPVVVENKPGGRANIGHLAVANAAPDGYTLLLATNSLPINQAAYKDLGFNALTSFTPISLIADSPIVVGTHPKFPAKTMAELVAYAKTRPVSYSSCGVASVYHLVGERIASVAGIKLVHVPYKGCSEALADVVSGNVDLFVNALPNVLPYMKRGSLVALAVTDSSRSALVPDVPTFSEATGIPNVVNQGWYSLVGPAGLPRDIVAKLNGLVTQALSQPDIQANLKTQLYNGKGGPPQVLTDLLTNDVRIWTQLIKDGGIQVQ